MNTTTAQSGGLIPLDLPTIKTAVQLACDDIYDPITPNVFSKIYRIGESVCGIVARGGLVYIVMQGTELEETEGDAPPHFSLAGWEADFDCLVPFYHPVLGNLHAGFYQNLPALLKLLVLDIPVGARIVVTGHSKGAGEAGLLGALLKMAGFDVIGLALFACPHPGYQRFADWLAANIPGVSFRNAPASLEPFGDPVPMVPLEPYVAPYPLTYIDRAPTGLERVMSVQWHQGPLYLQGVNALT